MQLEITTVDAFADRPFSGNPAAVCVTETPLTVELMSSIASEMNLSETAFLSPVEEGWSLRWFTPAVEVALCGHATLASAHVLWESGVAQRDQTLRFQTLSGELRADMNGSLITLDFPSRPATPSHPPQGMMAALGVEALFVGSNRMDYLVVVGSQREVEGIKPDFSALLAVDARGVIVTARSDSPDADFVSRFFAPSAGVNEDPVTGSAHCILSPFWSSHLGRNELVGRQLSARGGTVYTRFADDRVFLGGRAHTMLRGEMCLK